MRELGTESALNSYSWEGGWGSIKLKRTPIRASVHSPRRSTFYRSEWWRGGNEHLSDPYSLGQPAPSGARSPHAFANGWLLVIHCSILSNGGRDEGTLLCRCIHPPLPASHSL